MPADDRKGAGHVACHQVFIRMAEPRGHQSDEDLAGPWRVER
jgi:hypothetical protein